MITSFFCFEIGGACRDLEIRRACGEISDWKGKIQVAEVVIAKDRKCKQKRMMGH